MKKWPFFLILVFIVFLLIMRNTGTEFPGTPPASAPTKPSVAETTDNTATESTSDTKTETVPETTTKPPSDTDPMISGSCGDTITWTLDKHGTLTLRGTGEIPNFEKGANNQPWAAHRKSIISLVVEDGISRIGDRAFQSFLYLKKATLGKDVASIGQWAFQNCYALTSVELPSYTVLETGAFRSAPAEWNVTGIGASTYSTSTYQSALSQVVLTGNYREDVINIAVSQLGYHEGDSAKDHHGGNTQGSGDYTEYGRRLGSTGSAWCSEFASWCIRMAGVPTKYVAISHSANAVNFTENTSAKWYAWEDTIYGGGSYTPQKGDLLLWSWENGSFSEEDSLSHTSILLEVALEDNGNIVLKTIDGNSNNQVRTRSYTVDAEGFLQGREGMLCYIVAPDYEGSN